MAFGQGRQGAGFGRGGAPLGGVSRRKPSQPVLTWTSDATQLSPQGAVTFDNIPVAGDTVTSQLQVAGGNWASPVINNVHTITSSEDLLNEVDFNNTALSPGSYDWRVKITHNGVDSDWSTTQTKTLTGFSPALLSPQAWFEPAQGGMFQNNAGTTAANANGHAVAYLPDLSGNGFTLTTIGTGTSPSDAPTLQGVGAHPYLSFDGTNDCLRRLNSLGSYAAGHFTWAVALRGVSPAASSRIMAEGGATSGSPIWSNLEVLSTTTSGGAFWRQDGGSGVTNGPNGSNAPSIANVFDGNDHVIVVEWDGTTATWYKDGISAASISPSAGTFTLTQFSLGALLRAGSASNFCSCRIYGFVAVNSALISGDRANLTTYTGNLAGLSL